MGDNDKLAAQMDVIEEEFEIHELPGKSKSTPQPEDSKDKPKPEEQKATIHDSFDTFIVNDYFGEEDK